MAGAECFEQALRVLGGAAADGVFFDDSPLKVEAARAPGHVGAYIDGFTALRQALEAEGLLSS